MSFGGEFCEEFTIAIPYDETEVAERHLNEEKLLILRQSESNTYEVLKGVKVDTKENVISADANAFGKFAVGYQRTFGLIMGIDDGVGVNGALGASYVYDALSRLPNWASPEDGNPDAPLLVPNKISIEIILNGMKVTDTDTLVFYFAGHGGQVNDTYRETPVLINGCLDFRDEAFGYPSGEYFSDEYVPSLFRIDKWRKVKKVFILETCHAGGFVGTSPFDDGDLETLPNYSLLAASSEDSKAFTTPPDNVGIWTKELLPWIGILNLDDLKNYMLGIRDILVSRYGGSLLPVEDFHLPGETSLFEYDPVFFTSENFDANSPVVSSYPGDLNGSGAVDLRDFAILANHWLDVECGQKYRCWGADLAPDTPDGIVDTLDLAVFCEHWLEGTTP